MIDAAIYVAIGIVTGGLTFIAAKRQSFTNLEAAAAGLAYGTVWPMALIVSAVGWWASRGT